MDHINSFFSKVQKFISSDNDTRRAISDVLKKNNIQVEQSDIKLKDGVIYLKGSRAMKNELALRKEKILECIRISSPQKHFSDIV